MLAPHRAHKMRLKHAKENYTIVYLVCLIYARKHTPSESKSFNFKSILDQVTAVLGQPSLVARSRYSEC